MLSLNLKNKDTKPVFDWFEKMSHIPRGSGNMEKISEFCVDFAKSHGLKFVKDDANNVIIYKNAAKGYENAQPVILQGHLDMVCQKIQRLDFDFEKDGINIFTEGDFVKADGTTLGADNGIGAAMILAILESDNIPHPPIEAVFTTDEEIGMIGASKLDVKNLSGKKIINLDSEDLHELTVSCAGGSDFTINFVPDTKTVIGKCAKIKMSGLLGGHSGVEIHKGRTNANKLCGKILDKLLEKVHFDIISSFGGTKPNAIPNSNETVVCVYDEETFEREFFEVVNAIKSEICKNEPDFRCDVEIEKEQNTYICFTEKDKERFVYLLSNCPDGVLKMSDNIDGLVETSLNLGIMRADENGVFFHHALRSNVDAQLSELEEKMSAFATKNNAKCEIFGRYPSWEFKEDSTLQEIYKIAHKEYFGFDVKVCAIHAGLECGVFSSKIDGADCISVGPQLYDVHTVNERMSISSVEDSFAMLCKTLSMCK